MKKKIFSLLILVALCCSALCLFTACEGVEGDYTLVYTGESVTFSQDVDFNKRTPEEKRQLLESRITGKFTYTGNADGVTIEQILTGGGAVNGFDLSSIGTFGLRISYAGYSCTLNYTVIEA